MGQKCNPTGLRIGVIKNWDSRWYAKKGEFGDTLVEDYKLRNYLLESLHGAGVPKVEIERDAKRVRINIHCAKPGMVIGKQGAEIEKLKAVCAKKLGKDANEVFINIVEIKQPDLNATLVAQSVAQQLERRVSFRRAVKGAIRNTMRLGARGIKIMVSGRIGGAEIARSIKRVQFHFKQFVLTSTMVLQKQTQLMVRLVLRHGFTRAKYSANLVIREEQIVEKGEESNAFT